jgi:predicted O-methyltransferase YrrM
MNPYLEEILRTGYIKSQNGELLDAGSAISLQKGRFLQKIISEIKPVVCLEVGLAFGVSSLFICGAIEKTNNSPHIVINPYQNRAEVWRGIGLHNLRKSGYGEIVEFIELPSHQALTQLYAQGRKIDFAFIDGMHLFDYALVDFFLIDKIIKVGGILVFDDADWPAIRKLCRFIIKNQSYSVFKCLDIIEFRKLSVKRRILNMLLAVPGFSSKLHRLLAPEIIENDALLGLHGSCIAFRKEADDTRRWDFHKSF